MILSQDNGQQVHSQHITAWRSTCNIFPIGRYHSKSIYHNNNLNVFSLTAWMMVMYWLNKGKWRVSYYLNRSVCIKYVVTVLKYRQSIWKRVLRCKKMWWREKLAVPYLRFWTTPRYHLYFKTVIRPKWN